MLSMETIKLGDIIPEGHFKWIPYTPALDDHTVCGSPVTLSTDRWRRKRVVLFSVPGAFTPICHGDHLPAYLDKVDEFKAKGVDVLAVVSANDPFVMSGWGRFTDVKDRILMLSDTYAQWSGSIGLSADYSARGLGTRNARYAMIIENLIVKYLGIEPASGSGVTVSGPDAVLKALEKFKT
ncbi:hypothetical protein AX17_007290 [Amanita inopinata Kibby_2008]|nr:hypothetical protein AX17_007290 [Amanita inopinata Kibby_2008]